MAAIYEYTGVVKKVQPIQTFNSGFTKRDLVLTDDIDSTFSRSWYFHLSPSWVDRGQNAYGTKGSPE